MRFSIIVPVHNAGNTIEKCVTSLTGQPVELQILLIENGSKDDSINKCKELAIKHDNIEFYINDTVGVSGARNLGLQKAEGDIIGFCDADDYYEKDALRQIEGIIADTGADIVFSGVTVVKGDRKTKNKNPKNEMISSKKAIEYVLCNPAVMGSVCNKFYKSEVIKKRHFLTDITHLEDGYFNFELLSDNKNLSIYVTNVNTYYYVQRENSATNDIGKCYDEDGRNLYILALHKCIDTFKLDEDEKKLIGDQIFRIAVGAMLQPETANDEKRSRFLKKEIQKNWNTFVHRVFKFDIVLRLALLAKGTQIICTGKR